MSAFHIPRPALISFSGGRTSACMLVKIIEAYGGSLPDDIHVAFANTGIERAETLDFVQQCAAEWRIPIYWLEYDWNADHRLRIVDYHTACRNGEPYAALIGRKGFVPNVTVRFCSSHLKRDPLDRFVRYWLELDKWRSVIGLRFGEPRRVQAMLASNCRRWRTGSRPCLPPNDACITKPQVDELWRRQNFDLGLHSDEGNYTLCFLKGRNKLLRIINSNPALADWWIAQEAAVANRAGPDGKAGETLKRFRLGETYTQLHDAALANPGFFHLLDEPAAHDCFCTD